MMNQNMQLMLIGTMALIQFGICSPISTVEADTTAFEGAEDVVETVKASPAVQTEISKARKRINAKDSTREEIQVVGLGGGCGVAGCSSSYLVVITVHRGGANPQATSVLCVVQRSPKGILGRVSVVELKQKGVAETKLEVLGRYSSPLPVTRGVP